MSEDCEGTLTNHQIQELELPALAVKYPRKWKKNSPIVKALTKSLSCYCSGDDLDLDRKAFLRTVISRIEDDLQAGTQ